jgi:hypothetical protein
MRTKERSEVISEARALIRLGKPTKAEELLEALRKDIKKEIKSSLIYTSSFYISAIGLLSSPLIFPELLYQKNSFVGAGLAATLVGVVNANKLLKAGLDRIELDGWREFLFRK